MHPKNAAHQEAAPDVAAANGKALRTDRALPAAPARIELGHGRILAVRPVQDGAILRVASARREEAIELEIRFEAAGPVVRARAAALELDSVGDITTRCERFRVDARGDIDLQAHGQVRVRAAEQLSMQGDRILAQAADGKMQLRASEELQLLGELILLNCDRPATIPGSAQCPPKTSSMHDLHSECEDATDVAHSHER
jgi:hypothetical protein